MGRVFSPPFLFLLKNVVYLYPEDLFILIINTNNMNYLIETTEQEFTELVYPQIAIIKSSSEGILRFSTPPGYNRLDTSDDIFLCSDGDFLIKE